jgi:hypothetical protein
MSAALDPTTYQLALWFVRRLETMPVWLLVTGGCVVAVAWPLKEPARTFTSEFFNQFTKRLERSSREPVQDTSPTP